MILACEAVCKSDAGARTLWVTHCCFEHAGQIFGFRPRPCGWPLRRWLIDGG